MDTHLKSMMDLAERRIRDGSKNIDQQHKIIGRLRKLGLATDEAEQLLKKLEAIQRSHEEDLELVSRRLH